MRVVHFGYSDNRPGAARASYRLHTALTGLGVDSRMVVAERLTLDPTVETAKTAYRRWRVAQAHKGEFRLKNALAAAPPPIRTPRRAHTTLAPFSGGLEREVLRLQPDLVQLHWLGLGAATPASLVRLSSRPLVWRLADMWPMCGVEHMPEDDRFTSGYSRSSAPQQGLDLARWGWRRKNRAYRLIPDLTLVCPSRWMQEQCLRSMLFRERRVEIIPTGIDTTAWSPRGAEVGRRRWGMPQDRVVIAFGAVDALADANKGWSELEPALRILAELVDPASLHVFVFGAQQRFRGELPFPATVVGVLDEQELALAYSAADIFICPSRSENFPNTVLEAQACGVPTVAFDVGGLPDLVIPGQTGLLAQPRDSSDLARQLATLVRLDEGGRTRYARNCREHAVTHLDASICASKYARLYADILAQRAKSCTVRDDGAPSGAK